MESVKDTTANQRKMSTLQTMLDAIFAEVMVRGFHGAARIEFVVSDGTLQRLSRTIEEVER